MNLKLGKINVLNAAGLRKLSYPAANFFTISLDITYERAFQEIDSWIYSNLNNKYYIRLCHQIVNNHLTLVLEIGFEKENELTLFCLTCPHINEGN